MNRIARILAAASLSALASTAGPVAADSLAASGPPIEICLTVSHEILCANFVDAEGDPWAVVGEPDIYDGLEEGDDVFVSGFLCQINCPQFFCGSFEGIIVSASITDGCPDIGGGVPGDFDGGGVGFSDLLQLLAAFGACPPEGDCPEDLNSDNAVNFADLLILLSNWDS